MEGRLVEVVAADESPETGLDSERPELQELIGACFTRLNGVASSKNAHVIRLRGAIHELLTSHHLSPRELEVEVSRMVDGAVVSADCALSRLEIETRMADRDEAAGDSQKRHGQELAAKGRSLVLLGDSIIAAANCRRIQALKRESRLAKRTSLLHTLAAHVNGVAAVAAAGEDA